MDVHADEAVDGPALCSGDARRLGVTASAALRMGGPRGLDCVRAMTSEDCELVERRMDGPYDRVHYRKRLG
ncbi:hypothetical protein ACHBTE_08415 [Streptomyces sp. M41]|uniref:hypothetical protein n=1 Tax=Streptomyces sp. M41 TaxID=3059412 RepID=UPI00374D57C7